MSAALWEWRYVIAFVLVCIGAFALVVRWSNEWIRATRKRLGMDDNTP